jgi:flagella basal body P-ring formation protein FlgA
MIGVALLVWACIPARAAEVTIALKEASTVEGRTFALAEISVVTAGNPGLAERLRTIVVGTSPRPGYADRITRWQLARLVDTQVPELRGAVKWEGSEATVVRAVGVKRGVHELQAAGADRLYAALAAAYSQVKIEPVGNPQDLYLPHGKVELNARLGTPVKLGRRMKVWVDVIVDRQHYTTSLLWFSVSAFDQVLVARENLAMGAALRREDFRDERLDIAPIAEKALGPKDDLTGMRLKRPIVAGTPLTLADIDAPKPIQRNQNVTVQYTGGTIGLETIGVALSEGRIGDMVSVRNPSTNQVYSARVAGAGIVTVNGR